MHTTIHAASGTRRPPVPPGRSDTLAGRPAALAPQSGQRRSTAANRRATALADGWAGLPEGVTRWRLAAALRSAARALDISSPMLRLLEHYVDLSYDQDWAVDSEPVICRPLVEIAEHLGRSERQVRNIERALVERGLLAFRDSGNHARRGRRDRATGKLIYAYGPSLAPLGARAAEVIAQAASARREIAESRRLRLAISALRRRLRTDLDAADAAGIAADDLRAALDASSGRLPATTSPDRLRRTRDDLAALAAQALNRLGGPCPENEARSSDENSAHISAQQEISGSHLTDTSKKHAASGSCIALKKPKPEMARPIASAEPTAKTQQRRQSEINKKSPDHGVSSIPLALALAAAGPEIAGLTRAGGAPNWPTLIEAARNALAALGIDQTLWGEACGRLGRGGAALAAIILERGATRPPGGADGSGAIRRPSAYLRELLARADIGELHLDRSIRALAARPCANAANGAAEGELR